MKPKEIDNAQGELFKDRLSHQLNPSEPLFILANAINWSALDSSFGAQYVEGPGQPPKPVRLMIGLMILQHMFGLSDEQVVHDWTQNPYWQYFCGYDFFQWELPADGSSLTRWRKRIGEQGLEKVLSETIETALRTKTVAKKDLEAVIADTTVMEKNVAFPTDSTLLNKAREQLVVLAGKRGLKLRQSYAKVGKQAATKAGRYAHAKQFKRMHKQVKVLKNYLGRTVRDIERQLEQEPDLLGVFQDLLLRSKRLLMQTKESKDKLYSLQSPEVYCIAKGKAHKTYEFGCKVSLVVTLKQGLVLSAQALAENQYDGHTLKSSLEKAEEVSKFTIKKSFVDKGYRGHGITNRAVYMSGQKKGITASLKKQLKRRSAIEPHIGHMKSEGKLGRNYLKGAVGNCLNALLCAIGHNLRMVLRKITSLFVLILHILLEIMPAKNNPKYQPALI